MDRPSLEAVTRQAEAQGKPSNTELRSFSPLFYRELARSLRAARDAADKTQTEVADYLGTTYQQIQKYEKGLNRIPVYALVSLADFLEVPLSQLIARSNSE